jgi:pyruvate dehydrogenase E1 component
MAKEPALPYENQTGLTDELAVLDDIQRRVLWLTANIVHHANHVRPNPDGTKVGGHQASSASVVTLLTALYFRFLRPGDRLSVKPHASPAFHALQYLLGRLPRHYLEELRSFGGLQAYPSRTKDPDQVDFSTGSVGLGAVAPVFAALVQRFVNDHFGLQHDRRFVAVIGDAELDEGNVWEALLDEALSRVENVLWVVDLNRQSLDRVIPGVKAARLRRLFAEHGWRVLEAKYGRQLQALFAQPNGECLRQRIDEMSNEEYQALIRLPGGELRPRLAGDSAPLAGLLAAVPDAQLPGVLANLAGHDLPELLAVLAEADRGLAQPTVLFAYTIKGWGLPIAGHPLNHSMLLSQEQMAALRASLGVPPGDEWAGFPPDTPAGRLCAATAQRLYGAAEPRPALDPALVPAALDLPAIDTTSTQEVFGRILVRLADVPALRQHIVTCSPDVSVSTNLAGWINKTGVYARREEADYETEAQRLLQWKRSPKGQHIELGISEMNLFALLGMLGLSAELCGQPLIPIGTVYDPFVCRGLDALIYAVYSGSKFIFAGTPSGITLSPEGGAHQSIITPSIGAELPQLQAFEPCYGREVEWVLLEAMRECCDRAQGRATYLRLSTRPVDQQPFRAAQQRLGEAELRRQVLAGGYRLAEWSSAHPELAELRPSGAPVVNLVVTGAMASEALASAEYLWNEGVAANVLNLTSPQRLFEAWRAAARAADPLGWLIAPGERRAPLVTVHDAAPHSLAWLGSVYGAPLTALGVENYGQSGARGDLYHYYGLDAANIAEMALRAVDEL